MSTHFHEICEHGFVHTPCHCLEPTLVKRITCPPECAYQHQLSAAQRATVRSRVDHLEGSDD